MFLEKYNMWIIIAIIVFVLLFLNNKNAEPVNCE